MISKPKEIFNKLADERLEEMSNLDKKVDSNNLICKSKGNSTDAEFDEFDNALGIINKIRAGETSLADVKISKGNLNLI